MSVDCIVVLNAFPPTTCTLVSKWRSKSVGRNLTWCMCGDGASPGFTSGSIRSMMTWEQPKRSMVLEPPNCLVSSALGKAAAPAANSRVEKIMMQ